jgi:hypothetical protein
MRRFLTLSAALAVVCLLSVRVWTQTQPQAPVQQVLPPEARYWMGVTTGAGIQAMGGMGAMGAGGRPSMSDMMKMGMGGGPPSESHNVELRLGSTLAASAPGPEAFHTMPPGAQVNKPIYLKTPEGGSTGPGVPTGYRQPKGQITFYWGCGEKAGPGQPVVLTFDKLMSGENDPELASLQGAVGAREVRKPSPGTSKTYGDWPPGDGAKNRDLRATFAIGSSIAGPHTIQSTYAPKIEFTLPDGKSYMEGVRYTSTAALPSGSVKVSWATVARATGYSLGVMAPEKVGDDSANLVMWSSANRPATFVLMSDLTPAEVTRLIGLNAVLPPATTECAVPAEVIKATKMGSMLMFSAFGDEATYIHPPRPADPAVPWDQEWFARVSFKSTRMDMITPQGVQDLMGNNPAMSAGPGANATADLPPDAAMSDEEYCRALESKRKQQEAAGGGGIGGRMLGRMMGGKKKEEPVDPRCVKK